MAVSDEHKRLTTLGASWLRKSGFGVIATELTCFGSREQPDVLAFRSSCSAMIEVKVSRSDFLADRKKPERSAGGLGVYRFYLCPEGMITPEELPPKWGLLYAKGRSVLAVVKAQGNTWPAFYVSPASEADISNWRDFQHEPNEAAERRALYSIARRLAAVSQTA
ncbi:hypothetical protein [Pseudomonas savastanoi]|uniref:hypothetical protein n=1 Tax=Pseudomonas savastanoi TaxID=29438 RepID=UPI000E325E13|nr:hypothetical protein [Pseudomonas savastanoi]